MSETSNGGAEKALIEELRSAIITLCGPRLEQDNRESWLARGARKAGISLRQAKAYYYRECTNPRGNDLEKIRRLVPRPDIAPQLAELERLRTENALLRNIIRDAIASAPSRTAAEIRRADAGQGGGSVSLLNFLGSPPCSMA